MSQQPRIRRGLKRKRPKAKGTKAFLKMQRNEAVQVLLVIFALLGSLYFIQIKYREYKVGQILKEPALAVGTITQLGKYATVDFKAAGKTYSFKSKEPEELMRGRVAGDNVVVIYSRTDPDNAALKKGFTMILDD